VYFFSIYGKKFPKKNLLSDGIFPRLFRGGKRIIVFRNYLLCLFKLLLNTVLFLGKVFQEPCQSNPTKANEENSGRFRDGCGFFDVKIPNRGVTK
jgi:hypothetical protein